MNRTAGRELPTARLTVRDRLGGARHSVRDKWPLFALGAFAAMAFATYSLLRQWHFGSTGYDLGLFDQGVWHYSRFEPAVSTVYFGSPKNLLSDHFSPILVVLVPLYWVWDSVNVLLVAQAVLLALASIPIWWFVRRRLDVIAAYCFAGAYLAYWGVQRTVAFDFHEIAFAVPLIAFAILFADLERWGWFSCSVFLLLLVREDMTLLIAFIGVYLIVKKHRRQGLVCVGLGVTGFFVITKLLMPHFALSGALPVGSGQRWGYPQLGKNMLDAIRNIVLHPMLLPRVFFHPAVKQHTEFAIFAPFAALALFTPLVLLAIPLLAERFLSPTSAYWVQWFHYTATISPVVAMASADGLKNIIRWTRSTGRRGRTLAVAGGVVVLALNLTALPQSPLWGLTNARIYRESPTVAAGDAALAHIPADASVVAQNSITPHLTHRDLVSTLAPGVPMATYIITSASLSPWPFKTYSRLQRYLGHKEAHAYTVIFRRLDWTVLKQRSASHVR